MGRKKKKVRLLDYENEWKILTIKSSSILLTTKGKIEANKMLKLF